MVFTFIKYTQPTWQFNLQPIHNSINASCLLTGPYLEGAIKDPNFETESAQISDASYWLWQQGVLLQSDNNDYKNLQHLLPPSIKDEYTFLRKYWGGAWATYALLIRLITFNNPIKELTAYFASRKIKKISRSQNPEIHAAYNQFSSLLEKQHPLISIIIPTLNRYDYLKDVLHDLEKQTYKNLLIISMDVFCESNCQLSFLNA